MWGYDAPEEADALMAGHPAQEQIKSAEGAPKGDRAGTLLRQASLALTWERVWPCLWLPLTVVLIFLTASWLGLWLRIPPHLRMGGVGLFALALFASFIPLLRLHQPTREEALARLDRDSPDGHRPATAAADALRVGTGDPFTEAVWKAHLARQQQALEAIKVSPPAPGMARIDRRALRLAPMLSAVAALFIAGPEAGYRLATALNWSSAPPVAPQLRVDGWIDPPGYTRLPPIMLSFYGDMSQIRAPVKSTVIVRISGAASPQITGSGGLEETPTPPGVRQGVERRFTINTDGRLSVQGEGVRAATIEMSAVPDLAPTIEITEQPLAGQRGQLSVTYRARDDYGVASVEAIFKPLAAPARPGARPLIEPPRTPLPHLGDPGNEADVKATLELAEHPWAGARVTMTLVARDDAGQEGASAPRDITLPQRQFSKPLARSLVEIRRWIVLDVTDRPRAQTALDALLIEPGEFTKEPGLYLSLRGIAERLRVARTDQRLIDVVASLWELALLLEEGDLSDAERALRQAQDRLQQALERGAEQDEISRLTRELREAMDRYMRELAEQMQRDQQQGRQNDMARLPENFRQVTPRDLNRMLDRIEELNRRGETEEAQRLLNELNNIMRNLQMARPGQQDPRQREMQNQLGELDRLTREQQDLRDETFQDGQEQRNQRMQPNNRRNQQQRGQQQQGQRGPQQRGDQQQAEGQEGQEGQQGQMGQQGRSRDQMAQRQQQLRDRLREMQRRMQGMGVPNQQGLNDAEQAMGEAEGALGQGDNEGAAEAQGRALEGLRQGAQQLAQQMQQEGEGQGDGEGYADGDPQPGGRDRATSRAQSRDPLGRERDGQREQSRGVVSGDTRVPGEAAQVRARRILEELRRRLGESMRPQDEIEYLERLLRPR